MEKGIINEFLDNAIKETKDFLEETLEEKIKFSEEDFKEYAEELKEEICKDIVKNHPEMLKKILKYIRDKYIKKCPFCGSDKVVKLEMESDWYHQPFVFFIKTKEEVYEPKTLDTYDFCFEACLVCGKIIRGNIFTTDCE